MVPQGFHIFVQLVVQLDDPSGLLHAGLSGGGRDHFLAHPVKQGRVKFRLDLFQEFCQGGLGEVEAGGGLGNALLSRDLRNVLEIFDIHGKCSFYITFSYCIMVIMNLIYR